MAKAVSGNDGTVEGTAAELTPYQKFVNYSLQRAEVEDHDWDAQEITEDQIADIMAATDEDTLFAAMKTAGLTALQNFASGTELEFQGYRLVRGNLGIGAYAIIDAVNVTTSERVSIDTGIERVMSFLRMAEVMEIFPVKVIVVKKTTQSGNELVTLDRPVRRPVSSRTSE
jgi:hypothetical protein